MAQSYELEIIERLKAEEGTSSEMLKELQNLSEKSRNFKPPPLARPGKVRGDLTPQLCSCGMQGTPQKYNVRGFGVIFGSCFGCRG